VRALLKKDVRTRAISLSFIAVLALVATALLLRAERTTTPPTEPASGACSASYD
jgi:hypothetical protein